PSCLRPPRPPGSPRSRAERLGRRSRHGGGTRTERGIGSSVTSRLDKRGRSRRCVTACRAFDPHVGGRGSRRQPLATLAAPALDDVPATASAHASAEPVCAGSLALLRLV